LIGLFWNPFFSFKIHYELLTFLIALGSVRVVLFFSSLEPSKRDDTFTDITKAKEDNIEGRCQPESLVFHYDSYDEDPISLAGLGGVLKLELLLDPREWRGEPSKFESKRCG